MFVGVAAWHWLGAPFAADRRHWLGLLLALVFLDVATVSYWHMRRGVLPVALSLPPLQEAPANELRFEPDTQVAESLLTPRQWLEVKQRGLDLTNFEPVSLYSRVVEGDLEDGVPRCSGACLPR